MGGYAGGNEGYQHTKINLESTVSMLVNEDLIAKCARDQQSNRLWLICLHRLSV